MAVLIEAISVVVRNETILEKYPRGMRGFWLDCPNGSVCTDEYVTRVGFRDTDWVTGFVGHLEDLGFEVMREGEFVDVAIVDHVLGLRHPCRWLTVSDHPDGLRIAMLRGDLHPRVAKPSGWRYENSVSEWVNRVAAAGVHPDENGVMDIDRVSHITHGDRTMDIAPGLLEVLGEESDDEDLEDLEDLEDEESDFDGGPIALDENEIESYSRRLVAAHGRGTRPVWFIGPEGTAHMAGDIEIARIATLHAACPVTCVIIARDKPGDTVGVLMPLEPAEDAGEDGLNRSQNFNLRLLLATMSPAPEADRSSDWWNPLHWCRRWLGAGSS